MIDPERTIAAQATAAGQGAIAVIRMSGTRCTDVLGICTPVGFPARLRPRCATLTHILEEDGSPIDQVLVTHFPAPASYTGEDTVEISCHGGMLVTERLLKRLYQCGASPAEPGEFTKRAFLNGRMDLTQAEAVMDVISAGSDLALKAAQSQLNGSIGARVDELKDELVHVLAHVEAYIDFPDEDISPDTASALLSRLANAQEQLSGLLGSAAAGRLLREGIRTAIAGPPNVGKSSLLNTLLGYERAIVSNIAGTTRDTVEESIQIAGLALRLIDTAGVRESSDLIEQAGILRTNRALEAADLVLEVADASLPRASSATWESIRTGGKLPESVSPVPREKAGKSWKKPLSAFSHLNCPVKREAPWWPSIPGTSMNWACAWNTSAWLRNSSPGRKARNSRLWNCGKPWHTWEKLPEPLTRKTYWAPFFPPSAWGSNTLTIMITNLIGMFLIYLSHA